SASTCMSAISCSATPRCGWVRSRRPNGSSNCGRSRTGMPYAWSKPSTSLWESIRPPIWSGYRNCSKRPWRARNEMAKYIFVTGGVVSSLGKGIAAASICCLLESRGLKVTLQKFDPYLNVDPGTMSPFQHGEVFVTDDGAETDLDLGHYER